MKTIRSSLLSLYILLLGSFTLKAFSEPADQYEDGKAAQLWNLYIGNGRTLLYKEWIVDFLHELGARTVLDVACGTGVDSILLLEHGFSVTSCDASDKMLKHALQERWRRRKEAAFDQWVIEEANWLTLEEDFNHIPHPANGYDVVFCLGNSFAHLLDEDGNQTDQRKVLGNFWKLVAPGGVLILDHRNFDKILDTGVVPAKNLYYNSQHITDITCSNLYVNGKPKVTTFDYSMDLTGVETEFPLDKKALPSQSRFRLTYYPHRLQDFITLIRTSLGEVHHEVLGDFKALRDTETPAYYIHLIYKPRLLDEHNEL